MRIGLMGGECTGKSTLAADLADELRALLRCPVHVVPEALRAFVASHGRPPFADEQSGIMSDQRAAEDRLCQAGGVVIGDPATVMTAAYSALYFGDTSLWERAANHAGSYDLLLWCRPDLPWVADPGQRDGPAYRKQADDIIAEAITPEGPLAGARLHPISGTRQHRRDQAVTHAMRAVRDLGVWREEATGRRT